MSVALYIIGMFPVFICVTQAPGADRLSWPARMTIVVLWPVAFIFVIATFLLILWKEGHNG